MVRFRRPRRRVARPGAGPRRRDSAPRNGRPSAPSRTAFEKTYSNVGCAKADGAEVVQEGQCGDATPQPTKTPIFCTENYDPVCGVKDGAQKTYSNACFAKADDANVVAAGECPKP